MGIHRDSDKGGVEVLVWSPSVRKPQLDENYVGCVRKPQMNQDVIALLLSIIYMIKPFFLTMKFNTNIVIHERNTNP